MSTVYECADPKCAAWKADMRHPWETGRPFFCRTAGVSDAFRSFTESVSVHCETPATDPHKACWSDDEQSFTCPACCGRLAKIIAAKEIPAKAVTLRAAYVEFLQHCAECAGCLVRH